MFDIVFLDLDDTIFDFGATERLALTTALQSLGLNPTEEELHSFSLINDAHWKRLERGELTRREVQIGRFRMFFEQLGVNVDAEDANRRFMDAVAHTVCFFEGAEQLLRALRAMGKRLYVVSNATRSVQLTRLERAGLDHFFDGVFLSEEIGAEKPKREFFTRCFARVPNMKPDASIILGDSLTSDIQGGINAGIATCWFNPKEKPTCPDVQPTFTINRLCDFIELVK